MDVATFNVLVARMQSSVNEERQEAEKQYEALELTTKVSMLFQLFVEKGAANEVRSMCLVLLRRILSNNWEELAEALGANLKTLTDQLLKCIVEETESSLRRKLADVVAEIARNTIDDDTGKQKWTEVLQFLEQCISVGSTELNMTAMLLIEAVPNIFGADQDQYINGIKQLLNSSLTHADAGVRSAAAKAFVSFATTNDDDEALIKGLQASIPAIINICKYVVTSEDDDDTPIQALSELATCVPKVVTPHIGDICAMSIEIIANTKLDESYRHAAMEVLTTLCENAPNTIKKRFANYIPQILQSAVLLMTELDDDVAEWLIVDDIEEGDIEEDSSAAGESSLDRISCSLNGKVILQPFQGIAQHLLADGDWKKRHAALMGLSTIGEGCKRAMEPVINNVVTIIVPFLKDEHPRVRYAACNALGQMSSDFAPTLQKKCHEKVIAGLLSTVEDTTCPRVSAHAGAALVNFSEDCPQQVITPYLPVIMAKLEGVLEATFKVLQQNDKKIVLEQIITTIASVADAAKEVFIQFYDRLAPPLKYILQHSEDAKYKTLRGKTIECLSLIGLAVGKEKFHQDAIEIMNILSTTMPELTPDDPQCSYMISGWTRICKVLGSDFAPFLPMVMDPVIRAASYAPEVTVVDDDDLEEDPAWEFHPLGENQNFGIRTSGLEEKATACEMIICYARDMKEAFAPYVDQIAQMMIGHLKFMFHDGVRSNAAETIPCLLECVKSQGVEAMRRLWVEFFPALVAAAEKQNDEDADVLAEILNSISECITVLGREGLTAEEVQKIGTLLVNQFEGYETRLKESADKEAEEDEDPEEVKEYHDEELLEIAGIMARVSDIIHSGFSTLGEDFYPFVEPLLGHIAKLIDARRHYTDRQWGVCMLDDVVEFAPSKIAAHQDQFIPLMMQCLGDEYPEVRQAAAYGFGIMAMNGGAAYVKAITGALEPLATIISKPDSRETEEGAIAAENAIAAVAKILKHGGIEGDLTQIIQAFLSWLPTYEDDQESVHIYGYLCDLIENNHPAALGENNSNLPQLLSIIVSAFQLGAFNDSEETALVQKRLVNIIKMMHGSGLFDTIVESAGLDEEKKKILHGLLTQEN